MSKGPKLSVESKKFLSPFDIDELCEATIDTMKETVGFNIGTQTLNPIERAKIMAYWEGVQLVPERKLFVCKLDGSIAGAVQLVLPSPSNQTSRFRGVIDNHFVAPWGRGHGLSNMLLEKVEDEARVYGLSVLTLSVRETREAAIKVFEKRGYVQWGKLPMYELDQGRAVSGIFYYKEI